MHRKNKDVDNRAYKFRLIPSAEQKVLINKTFGCARFVYNHLLDEKTKYYQSTGASLKKEVSEYKSEFPFLKEVDSLALANAKQNLDTAFKNFFEKRADYPTFHKKGRNDRYTTNVVNGNIEIVPGGIKLPKLGVVKAKFHRAIGKDETIKNCTISRKAGKYYIAIITELEKTKISKIDLTAVTDDKAIGFDFSVPYFYVDSFGNEINYPKFYKQTEEKLKLEQKKLSKKTPKSKNYYKQLLVVQKLHQKVTNQRLDWLHKLSTNLVKQYEVFCFEDLDLSALKETNDYGKSISDEGFGMFRMFVQYKSERAGKYFVKIDKWFASSKTCSHCGRKNDDVVLGVEEWICPICGAFHLRDHNAAINIKREGLRILFDALASLGTGVAVA